MNAPVCLTIAGTDPSGGAGIQADLRAFQALGVAGTSVVTAVLSQNSQGVRGIFHVPPRVVASQIDAVVADALVAAVKIGMLSDARTVSAVAARIPRRGLPNVVLDPVLAAKDGTPLLQPRGVERLIADLLPRTLVVTPNAPEAAALAKRPVDTLEAAREAARILHGFGPRFVIVKGGHLPSEPVDVLFDGESFLEMPGERLAGPPVRGTGCLFSAALAARVALGDTVPDAALAAKAFVAACIASARQVGKGARVWF